MYKQQRIHGVKLTRSQLIRYFNVFAEILPVIFIVLTVSVSWKAFGNTFPFYVAVALELLMLSAPYQIIRKKIERKLHG